MFTPNSREILYEKKTVCNRKIILYRQIILLILIDAQVYDVQ